MTLQNHPKGTFSKTLTREEAQKSLAERPPIHEDTSWVSPLLPKVLPRNWQKKQEFLDGASYLRESLLVLTRPSSLSVIMTGSTELDGKRWLHVSCAYPDRLPTWEDILQVKDIFIGKDKLALQVFPSDDKYVNINSFVLHLWHCLDGDPTPDFTRGGSSL